MRRHSNAYISVAATIAIGVCASALSLVSAPAAGAPVNAPTCALPYLAAPHVQRKIIEAATLGIVPLRQYVWNTRIVYGLDLMQTVDWLDQARAAQSACVGRASASAVGADRRTLRDSAESSSIVDAAATH
jgi:hypothetical protein